MSSELTAACLAFALAAHIFFLHKERKRNQRYCEMLDQSHAAFEKLRDSFESLKDTNATLQSILNTKIEGYTLRYSVGDTGTYDGASAEGKTVEEAVKKLGEKLDKLKEGK